MSEVAPNGYAVLPLETELPEGALETSPLFGTATSETWKLRELTVSSRGEWAKYRGSRALVQLNGNKHFWINLSHYII
jgi:hypothetical protein